jgi:secreted PhoX family phosphatase
MNARTSAETLARHSHDSEDHNTSHNPSLNDIIDARLSRRGVFKASLGTAGAAVLGSLALSACGGGGGSEAVPVVVVEPTPANKTPLGFKAIAKSKADTVVVAEGYAATPIYALGDPLTAATPAYKNDGTDTDFDNRAGDHHDGMEYFGLNAAGTGRDAAGSARGLLVMNHEALTDQFLHAAGTTPNPRPASESDKEIPAHGVSIVEVRKNATGKFEYQQASAYNRRITPLTPMQLNGVARGNALMKTVYSADGTLCRGTVNNCGTGQWIELSLSNATVAAATNYKFADAGDVAMNSRLAADAVGATRMDRPEWCAVNPVSGEIYYTLTNNSNRKVSPTGSQQSVDAVNPRSYLDADTATSTSPGNINGHIVRMRESTGDGAATSFTWDVYLFGAQANADTTLVNLSGLTNDQDFSSPDGLWFSPTTGFAFIQTDDGAYTDVTNCMMLIGRAGTVGDGTTPTLSYAKTDGSKLDIVARVGAKPTAATLRRFLVGPVDCEITGCTETPDGKTIFVNIQHPGESIAKADVANSAKYLSHWPANAGYGAGGATTARPRSATIVITKNDGGLIGS